MTAAQRVSAISRRLSSASSGTALRMSCLFSDTISARRGVVREFEERHWVPQNAPFRANGGAVSHVIHRVEDVTAVVRAGHFAAGGAPPVSRKYLVPLGSNVDLPRLREVVRHACAACELGELAAMDLLVAASELGRNIVGNGGSGTVEVSEIGFDLPRGIRLSF